MVCCIPLNCNELERRVCSVFPGGVWKASLYNVANLVLASASADSRLRAMRGWKMIEFKPIIASLF